MTAPRFLSVPETAALLRLSPTTVRARIHDGTIPAVRIRRTVRVRVDQLLAGQGSAGQRW